MSRLNNKRVLITQSDDYMGPAISKLFTSEGAMVTNLPGFVPFDSNFTAHVANGDDPDIVIANLAHHPCNGPLKKEFGGHSRKVMSIQEWLMNQNNFLEKMFFQN